jgi:hypothetical protein
VPRLAQSNQELYHAMVAIGALHESLGDPGTDPSNTALAAQPKFALEQCNKAIGLMVKRGESSNDTIATLTLCIFFVAFEILQSNLDSALAHFRSGLAILQTWKNTLEATATQSERNMVNEIATIMKRFGESCDFEPPVVPMVSSPASSMEDGSSKSHATLMLPDSFSGVEQAAKYLQEVLDLLFAGAADKIVESPGSDVPPWDGTPSRLKMWRTRYRRLCESSQQHKLDFHTRRQLRFLNIHYFVGKIMYATKDMASEMDYDPHCRTFEKLVEECRKVVRLEQEHIASERKMYVSFDLGIIMPLYFTGTRCRDPQIRRQAQSILQTVPRREGIWLSWITGNVVQAIIEREEAGHVRGVRSCADVLLEDRVELLEMQYDPCPIEPDAEGNTFAPQIQLIWRSVGGPNLGNLESFMLHIGRTRDCRPGQRPYSVFLPKRADFDSWKLLIGKKSLDPNTVPGPPLSIRSVDPRMQ